MSTTPVTQAPKDPDMTPTFAQEATRNGKSLITSYQASLLLSENQERASKKPEQPRPGLCQAPLFVKPISTF